MTVLLSDYLGRITPWQSGHLRYTTTVSATLGPHVDQQVVTAGLPDDFDLNSAIGVQLDAVGQWIGPTRNVTLPLSGIYFSLNDPLRGLNQGVLKGPYDTPTGITSLDDGTYRRLLYAVVLANRWDGTVPGAQAVFDTFFIDPATHVFVQDDAQAPALRKFFALNTAGAGLNQGEVYQRGDLVATLGSVNAAMTVGISGRIPPPVQLGLLAQHAIPIKPGGVRITYAVTSVTNTPLFGIGVENEFVSGLNVGAMGVPPEKLLAA